MTQIYQDMLYLYSVNKTMPRIMKSTKISYLNLNMSLHNILNPDSHQGDVGSVSNIE